MRQKDKRMQMNHRLRLSAKAASDEGRARLTDRFTSASCRGREMMNRKSYFFTVATLTSSVLSSLEISPERVWAFLPSLVQPAITLTTFPPLSMRMFVGMVLASKVFQVAPWGSAKDKK